MNPHRALEFESKDLGQEADTLADAVSQPVEQAPTDEGMRPLAGCSGAGLFPAVRRFTRTGLTPKLHIATTAPPRHAANPLFQRDIVEFGQK